MVNAGYVRLSRDDERRNYISIENQKLIISQFAAEYNQEIHRWYEDDGVSGYKFDRPGFQKLMEDLDQDIDRVYVKDFSRLGRHNAKVLLLLDDFLERGKQLIVIDDKYDSCNSQDETIGIKTWYNERYIKDISKKITSALRARQKEGNLKTRPPFGYKWSINEELEIVAKEAHCVKKIFDLYLQGYGYGKIATYLAEESEETPSMARRYKEIKEGKVTKGKVVTQWSQGMVKDIINNDFYMGTLRLGKRARTTVHGKDWRVAKEKQYVFENHHLPIIPQETFEQVQKRKTHRRQNNEGGLCGREKHRPFCSCLFCKDCGSPLTPITRRTSQGERRYYICSTYNRKGKRYCEKSHLIGEADLLRDMICFLKGCKEEFGPIIATYGRTDSYYIQNKLDNKRNQVEKEIQEKKEQLKVVFSQKTKDLSKDIENQELIVEGYDRLQREIMDDIKKLEIKLEKDKLVEEQKEESYFHTLSKILKEQGVNPGDISILVDRIEVDGEGSLDIQLKCDLPSEGKYSLPSLWNAEENQIIYNILKGLIEDQRQFISVKYVCKRLGPLFTSKRVLPYIRWLLEQGVIRKTDHNAKPYLIIKSKEEIITTMEKFL